jgi:hypothetical protein
VDAKHARNSTDHHTVAGTTRIEHPCGTCGDRDATDFFLFRFTCSHSSADTAPTFPVQ